METALKQFCRTLFQFLLAICSGCILWEISLCERPCQGAEPNRINSSLAVANETPSNRYVLVERAEIHSGPSAQYYPTCFVKKGESIEVHHRTNDGWLGIRPPKGSFSWLPATQGYLLPGGRTVEVTDDAAVSWIGSELGTAKQYRWQIRLHPGEQLTILGEAKMVGEDDRETLWYRIAPPAGEFRWIRAEATSETPLTPIAEIAGSTNQTVRQERSKPAAADSSPSSSTARESRTDLTAESSAVVEASYEGAVIAQEPAQKSRPRSTQANARRSSTHRSAEQDQWTGWHALEYSSQGWTFPALDRLLGNGPKTASRNGSDANSPVRSYDPYDLTQQSSDSIAGSVSTVEPSGTLRRPWRNPEQLRQRRLAMLVEESGKHQNAERSSEVDPVPSDSSVKLAVGSGVTQLSATEIIQAADKPISTTSTASYFPESSRVAGAIDVAPSWFGISKETQPTAYSPLEFSNFDLSQLHIALSEIVSQPMETWRLSQIADRVRHLVEHGASAIERGEARLLLERIQSFQSLAQRSVGLFSGNDGLAVVSGTVGDPVSESQVLSAGTPSNVSPLQFSGSPLSGESPLPVRAAQPYDATGLLVPVHASRPNQPTFALTDESGKIIAYLSAAPGLNLGRYANQAVGVFGLRGYLPNLKTNHLEAQRVVRLR